MVFLSRPAMTVAACVLVILTRAAFAAADVPEIKDDGKFFSADVLKTVNAKIKEFERASKREIIVETYPAIPPELQEQFRTLGKEKFFQEWLKARFEALRVTGVLILICKDPASFRVAIGEETFKKAFTQADRDRLTALMLDRLSSKKYDAALVDGVNLIISSMEKNLRRSFVKKIATATGNEDGDHAGAPGEHAKPRVGKVRTEIQNPEFDWSILIWIGGGLIALWLVFGLIRALTRPAYPPPGAYGPPVRGMPPAGNYPPGGYPQPGYPHRRRVVAVFSET